MSSHLDKPELLSPAGNWDCARAAVIHGADAIFFGLQHFNARMRADNFKLEDLGELMPWLHARGVKGYVTVNTLIFPEEILDAEQLLIELDKHKVDAVIVQDVGLADLARKLVPNLRIHASTQMTITSPEGVAFAHELGVKQVVLARELSMKELSKFEKIEDDKVLPLEVFVHGALCVAYSGQCLTSESLGQRSANRGECAQACRLPYDLVVDGELLKLDDEAGEKRYLLSPQDLAAVDEIPKLIDLGIKSFKIEGRLKNPDYVAAVTEVYRKAIDAALDNRISPITDEDRYKLEMTFSRGLYTGWLNGVHHQELVHARYGKKRGPFAGTVIRTGHDWVEIDSQLELNPGDGVVFDIGGDTEKEQGGRLYEVRPKGPNQRLMFQAGKINFSKLQAGDRVWKTDDPQLRKQVDKSLSRAPEPIRSALDIKVMGSADKPMRLSGSLASQSNQSPVTVHSDEPLQAARNRPLTSETLTKQLGRLGQTPFELGSVDNQLKGDVMLPVSEINKLRRKLVDALLDATSNTTNSDAYKAPKPLAADMLSDLRAKRENALSSNQPQLAILCRTMTQVQVALSEGVQIIYTDFEDVRGYKDAVELVRSTNTQAKIYPATPRIQKAGEQGYFSMIAKLNPDGVLVRNLGAMDWFRKEGFPLVGDFSLNVANPLSARVFMEREGRPLERVTISYDLNYQQVLNLIQDTQANWLEITLHQHMPMFHMEHCVFAAFLSDGKDYNDCGRPCEKHEVGMKDRLGTVHPLKADVGCRNTVYHEKAQSGASYFSDFLKAGARYYRAELLDENEEKSRHIIQVYQKLFKGEVTDRELYQSLKVHNQLGVTSGTLTVLQ